MNNRSSLILKNTLFLYTRMLVTMWLNLFATRLVLRNLGVEDMGIYGIVGSVVSIFSILTSGLTTAIQRFITFELGLGEKGRLHKVFCTSLNMILIFMAIMVVALELGGIPLVEHEINIPQESRAIAILVFQFCIVNCICNLVSIPYNAMIMAHEKFNFYAQISVVSVALTCLACYSLEWIDKDIRLISYAIALAGIAICTTAANIIYCHIHFGESKYKVLIDHESLSSMGRFVGISSISGVLQLITSQGIIMVINLTFGVVLNAVYTIALQLKNMVLSFSFNILKAIQPQIIKTYAEGDTARYRKLVLGGTKAELYMVLFILVPFMLRTRYILTLWLGDVPEYTVTYCRFTILLSAMYATFEPVRHAVYATNRIKHFVMIPDSLMILTLPISYIVGRMTGNPEYLIMCIVGVDLICCAIRLWLGTLVSEIQMKELIGNTILRGVIVVVLSLFVCYGLTLITNENISGILLLLALNSIALCAIIFCFGLSQEERKLLYRIKKVH